MTFQPGNPSDCALAYGPTWDRVLDLHYLSINIKNTENALDVKANNNSLHRVF